MTVGRDYMLKKGPGPSVPKQYLDTKVVPLAVNAAGSLEVALDRASVRLGLRPAVVLAGAVGLVSFAVLGLILDRGPRREKRFRGVV
jgi:hypothetical protein